ncbi:MAG: hypothetical protein ACT443_13995 [Gemmatimonadota bacterium]
MDDTRRFLVGLLASTIVIATVGFALYIKSPTPLQPTFVHQSASVMAPGARVRDPERDRYIHDLLTHFVAALAEGDVAAMREDFPDMTRRQSRVLRSIRRRLDQASELEVASQRVIGLTKDLADVDFVIVARRPGEASERRLPFHATVRRRDGGWQIGELN